MTLTTQGLQTLDQVRDFVDHSAPLGFKPPNRASTYDWLTQELRRFGYARLGKPDKGLLKRYLARVTGLSRAQVTRLVQQFVQTGRIADRRGRPAQPFPRRYTAEDVRWLAEIDALHGTLSGPATRKLCERVCLPPNQQSAASGGVGRFGPDGARNLIPSRQHLSDSTNSKGNP